VIEYVVFIVVCCVGTVNSRQLCVLREMGLCVCGVYCGGLRWYCEQ
jgi:hypothetical protein